VLVNNQNTTRIPRRKIPPFRQRLGIVFQDHKLLYDRSVFDNVALPLVIAGASRREIEKRVRAALDQVGLRGRESHAPITLSTGEQQRVGIARAVAPRPDVLIADEPTGNLDPELSLEIMELFTRFNEVGVTLLIATHDLELIERMPSRRIRLVAGQIAGDSGAENA
jgi:cell division transport system ATP-binding protein